MAPSFTKINIITFKHTAAPLRTVQWHFSLSINITLSYIISLIRCFSAVQIVAAICLLTTHKSRKIVIFCFIVNIQLIIYTPTYNT